MGVTIFSTCKPFTGTIAVAQHNAIRSWKALGAEVIILDQEEGSKEAAEKHDCIFIPDVVRNSQGHPMMASLFKLAEKVASSDILCYANADIILLECFLEAVERVKGLFEEFLIVSHRTNLKIKSVLAFPDDVLPLRLKASKEGRLDVPCAIDVFCFTRGLYLKIPPFVHARRAWDNWLIWDVLRRKLPVVDVTRAVTVIHQEHGQYKPSSSPDPERSHNRRLLQRLAKRPIDQPIGFITHSNYVMTVEGEIRER